MQSRITQNHNPIDKSSTAELLSDELIRNRLSHADGGQSTVSEGRGGGEEY